MNNIHYFQATEADIGTLIQYRIEVQYEFHGPPSDDVIQALRISLEDYFRKELNKTCICWLAEAGGKTVGTGMLVIRQYPGNSKNPSGISGYIMSMYTIPSYRGKGISSNILNHLVASAEKMGVHAFELHATKMGEPVYIKNGFEEHNEPTYRKYTF